MDNQTEPQTQTPPSVNDEATPNNAPKQSELQVSETESQAPQETPTPSTPVEPAVQSEVPAANNVPTATPVASQPNQVEVNNRLNMLLQGVEALKEKVGDLLDINADVKDIHEALDNVRNLVADKLGFKKNEQGNLVPKV
jgi:hypothetical protein